MKNMLRRGLAAVVSFALISSLAPAPALATPYALTAADRAEITQVLHRFFDAARDGRAPDALREVPTAAEMQTLWLPGNEPMMERQRAAVERDVAGLRERFAGGTWVGIGTTFAAGSSIELSQCGRFTVAGSECVMGPVIEWRAGGELQHMRVDKLIRLNGHWKIWDPRI